MLKSKPLMKADYLRISEHIMFWKTGRSLGPPGRGGDFQRQVCSCWTWALETSQQHPAPHQEPLLGGGEQGFTHQVTSCPSLVASAVWTGLLTPRWGSTVVSPFF